MASSTKRRKALDLVPAAGSCDACPKRAGNDPEALADGCRADVCLDPECYRGKVDSHRRQEAERFARKHGIVGPVVPVEEPFRGDCPPRGFCDLAGPVNASELNDDNGFGPKFEGKTVADVLAGAGGWEKNLSKLLAFDEKGKPRTLVRTAEARKRLVAAGLMARPERAKPAAAPPRSPVERLIDEACGVNGSSPSAPTAAASDEEPTARYRVTVDWAALGAVEFDAYGDDAPSVLFADALGALDLAIEQNPDVLRWERVKSPAALSGPLVCAPVGGLKLSAVGGLAGDAACLTACGLRTLADLEAACGGNLSRVEAVLGGFPGAFTPGDVARIARAVRDHFRATPEPKTGERE
jgi:hypothetical protein